MKGIEKDNFSNNQDFADFEGNTVARWAAMNIRNKPGSAE